MQTYIFDSDETGSIFCEALVRAARRGVAVRVLIDDVGARYSRSSMLQRLRKSGVAAATFLPTSLPRLFRYANLRNHRKIMVVDGGIGFTGGMNLRAGHWLSRGPQRPTRCLHFGLWSLIGSTNWDARSLRLNFEYNVECYDPSPAKALQAIVHNRIQHAQPLSAAMLHRSTLVRLRDGLARLLSPYL